MLKENEKDENYELENDNKLATINKWTWENKN